jgi:hypothetical protein
LNAKYATSIPITIEPETFSNCVRKRVAQQARENEIEAMPKRGADAAAQKHNEIAHRMNSHVSGQRKAALRRTDSYRRVCAVGVISPLRAVSGDPIPIAANVMTD